jgi:hypothetical protein
VLLGGLGKLKKSNDLIGTRIRAFRLTTLPHVPQESCNNKQIGLYFCLSACDIREVELASSNDYI